MSTPSRAQPAGDPPAGGSESGGAPSGGSASGGPPEAKVLTVSDGVAAGARDDLGGPALIEALTAAGWKLADHRACPDGVDAVAAALRDLAGGFRGLVVTTGGTGFGPRDLTPEATSTVVEREAPGIAEAIRRVSDAGGRGFGMLSRGRAGVVGEALVVNLPGSPRGAVEALETVLAVLPHALELLAGGRPH